MEMTLGSREPGVFFTSEGRYYLGRNGPSRDRCFGRRPLSIDWIWKQFIIQVIISPMKVQRKKKANSRADNDPLIRYSGPAQTVAASVPRALTAAIRAKVGKREFSSFVARAMARELVDQNRAVYVSSYEKEHGPIDEKLTASFEVLFSR